jgi:hypothetical protein
MKIASLSFSILGVICLLMACLTALKVSPAFTSDILDVGKATVTTAFWGGLAALSLLAGIAFGVIVGKE